MPVKVSLLKITQVSAIKKLYEENHIIQDLLVPTSKMEKCLQEIDDAIQVYPTWLCPFILANDPGMVHPKGESEQMYVDIGVYGVPKRKFDAQPVTRRIESLVADCGGFQMLYAGKTFCRSFSWLAERVNWCFHISFQIRTERERNFDKCSTTVCMIK